MKLSAIRPGCALNTTDAGKQRIPARIPARLPRRVPEKLRSSARGLEPQRPAARLGLIQGFLNFWVFVFFALNGQVLSQKSSEWVKFQERKEFLSQFLFSGQYTGLAAFYGFGSPLYFGFGSMVSQTKNKLDLFQKCRFEKTVFPKFEKRL